jgi:hypothetical protein
MGICTNWASCCWPGSRAGVIKMGKLAQSGRGVEQVVSAHYRMEGHRCALRNGRDYWCDGMHGQLAHRGASAIVWRAAVRAA